MMKRNSSCLVVVVFLLFGISSVLADVITAPSASGPQWQSWQPRANHDVGDPAFMSRESNTMGLYYGFRGAVVFDKQTQKWERVKMGTITRHKVEGHVNQVNDSFALAAGLHEVAVYDFSKHKWFLLKDVAPDDSTGQLTQNFVVTPQYVQVKQLNGRSWKYTPAGGWRKQ